MKEILTDFEGLEIEVDIDHDDALSDFISDYKTDLAKVFRETFKWNVHDVTDSPDWITFCKEQYTDYVDELRLKHGN